MKRSFWALGLLPLTLSACMGSDPGFGGAPADPADLDPHLVLRIEDTGGFMPLEYTFTQQPSLVVMSDGKMYTMPAMIDIYPSPLHTSYEVRELSAEGLDALIDRAIEAGLTEDGTKEPDQDGSQVADASTTVFTFVDRDGAEHRVSAYALGFGDTETAERRKLQDFRTALGDLESWMPEGAVGDSTIEPTARMRVGVTAYGAPDEELPQEARAWPLETPLASFGTASEDGVVDRCAILEDADLETFLSAAEGANVQTPWTSDGKRYRLLLDPLTPDEAASCTTE